MRKAILFTLTLLAAGTTFALNCPSVSAVKNAQLNFVESACDEGKSCGDYVAAGFIVHNGQNWAVGSGIFNERSALRDGQSQLSKASSPWIYNSNGQDVCVYYVNYIYNKFVAAIPMENQAILKFPTIQK